MQFVRALRIHKAKQLLERGDLNVSEVAFEVGFDDPKYFGRVFAEETGMPPTQWRKKA
jgi:AraC-like DNA-binding protein